MPFFRSRGLSFRRKRKKVTLTAARSMALLIGEIAITLFIAFVLVYCVGMKVTVVGNSMEDTLTDGESVLVNRFTYNLTDPKSGDVVVFTLNENDDGHYYIKRVVAVPGDTVQIRDGILYVNGEMFDEEDTEAIQNAGLAEEEITVEDGEFFVLGDNRNSSEDSRYANIGNIQKDCIAGKVWFHMDSLRDMGRVK